MPNCSMSHHCLQVLDYELIKLDLAAKGQKDPRFIKMHPWGKVPV